MKNKAHIVICSRPQSKRFSRKVFRPLNGTPAIEVLLKRLSGTFPIVLAVPQDINDYDYLIDIFPEVNLFKGNPESPLHRISEYLLSLDDKPEYIVRVTHDDILIDTEIMIDLFNETFSKRSDYGITPDLPDGCGVEIIKSENLIEASKKIKTPTEYVSYAVKNNSVLSMEIPEDLKRPEIRLTMDYYEDWILLDLILSTFKSPFVRTREIIKLMDNNPYLFDLNRLPSITAYTCVYNQNKTILKTINSIITQRHQNYEYIIVDDRSNDGTEFLVASFSSHPKIKIIRNEKRLGLASSSNVAIDHAKGDYVIRIDGDDELKKDALRQMETSLKLKSVSFLYSAYNIMDENDVITSINNPPEKYHHPGCALMSKRYVNEIRFKDGIKYFDGYDLYKRIKDKKIIGYEYNPMWYYRRSRNSLSSQISEEKVKILREIENGL